MKKRRIFAPNKVLRYSFNMADMNKNSQTENTNQQQDAQNASEQGFVAKFQALPKQTQFILIGVVVLVLFVMISGRGRDSQPQPQVSQADATTAQALQQGESEQVFTGLEIDTPELLQSWFRQNEQGLANLQDQVGSRLTDQDEKLSEALVANQRLQQEMMQTLQNFNQEISSMRENEQRDREVLSQLAEETRRLQLNSPASGQITNVAPTRKRSRIAQTPLGGAGGGIAIGGDQALLSGVANTAERVADGESVNGDEEEDIRRPFVPPLGFVKATLLNGVDALVGGTATPSLAKLQGVYRTAHNGTVNLDGCFALIEFNGEISTERAIGKPSRITCVYPDQGVSTYSVSGYVVDADDGIIGVPGVFYEGDATRLAAAMIADFAAGVADVIETNQSTFTTDSSGNAQQTLTGDQAKAEIAGGVGSAVTSLRDYLFERANRVLPFIRIDATRDIHVVLLSGVELRTEGNPWTLLYAADE